MRTASKKALTALIALTVVGVLSLPSFAQTDIRFMFWGASGAEADLWFNIVDRFNELHPHIRVEPVHTPSGYEEKLVTMMAGGVMPDVVLIEEEPYITFVQAEAFLDLTERFEKEFDPRAYNQVALRFLNVNGRYYALPWDLGIGVLFHNTTLLAEAGLALPPLDFTWSTFLENAQKLTRDRNGDGSIDQWGTTVAQTFRGFSIYAVWGFGGDLVDDPVNPREITITRPNAVRGLQAVTDLIHRYGVAPRPGTPQPRFANGNQGMQREGTWAFLTYRQQIRDFEWDVTFFPRADDVAQSGGYLGPDNIAISRSTQAPDAAWEFVKFVIGPEGQEMIGRGGRSVPALTEAAVQFFVDPASPPRNAEGIILGAEGYGRLVPQILNFRQMESEWSREIQAMLAAAQSPEVTAQRIAEITARYLNGNP